MTKLEEKRRDRAKLVADARAILDKAETETRKLTAEEQQKYAAIFTDVREMGDEIKRYEQQEAAEAELARSQGTSGARPDPADAGAAAQGEQAQRDARKRELRAAFNRFLAVGPQALKPEELRALQSDTDVSGGYLRAPEEFVASLIKFVDDAVYIRQGATKFTLTQAASMGFPSLDTDVSDADWTTEIGTGSEDSSMATGKRELKPHPLAKLIKVSKTLLRTGAVGVEELVRQRLGYKQAVTQEKAFLTGTGAAQPLGVMTASAQGISTSRDYATGNDTTSIKFDGLIGCKYNLKPQYRNSMKTRWLFHRDGVSQIVKLKDGEGRYIWQPSVVVGQPDMLLNIPVWESEFMSNTFTTGLYVGILGDWSFYWIVDTLNMQIQRLEELYAATNQTGFISRSEVDGAPVLEEAFSRVKLG